MRRLALAALALLPSAAFAQTDPGPLCDRLAASPLALSEANPGVEMSAIDHAAAIPACEEAVRRFPREPRYRYQLGRALHAAERYDEARAAYEAAASAGVGFAYQALGKMHELGEGTGADPAEAARLYQLAIDAGAGIVAADLGYLYEIGAGVEQDYARAAELYEIAAAMGDPYALAELGWLYNNGFGVPQDLERAAELYTRAAELGEIYAQNNLATFYEEGLGGLPQDLDEAVRLFNLAGENGNALAFWNLGNLYAGDKLGPPDPVRAESYLRRAISTGSDELAADARNSLAWMWATNGTRLYEALQLSQLAVRATAADHYNRANYLDTEAFILVQLNRPAEALPLMEEAIAHTADYPPFHDRLGDILAALGRADEARAAWQRALDLPDSGDFDRAATEAKLAG